MTWVRIDDGFADHPKIAAAGPLAAIIQVRALCYCARHLTDGFVPEGAVGGLLAGMEHISVSSGGVPGLFDVGHDAADLPWPAIMIEANLWEKVAGGYRVHDYLDYNPSKQEVTQLRRKKAKAGKAGGQARAVARALAPVKHAVSEEDSPRTRTRTPTPESKATSKPTDMSGKPDVALLASTGIESHREAGSGIFLARNGAPPAAQPRSGSSNGARNRFGAQAREILAFLNKKSERNYQPGDANLGFIAARLSEGATVTQCRAIIGLKAAKWKGDPKMAEYLRPATLFNREKFAQYLGELPASAFEPPGEEADHA